MRTQHYSYTYKLFPHVVCSWTHKVPFFGCWLVIFLETESQVSGNLQVKGIDANFAIVNKRWNPGFPLKYWTGLRKVDVDFKVKGVAFLSVFTVGYVLLQ